jgi:methionine synthase II (cobalamin-independent)
MVRSHLTTSASLRGILTGSCTPPPKSAGRHGRSADGFYADIAQFAKQAHRDGHRTGLSVRAAIAAKRDVTPEVANKWRARARKAGHLQETREQAQTT